MSDIPALIERLYVLFKARELEEAAALFADGALLEYGAPRRQQRGGDQLLERRSIIEWLGTELDAARRIVRPDFDR